MSFSTTYNLIQDWQDVAISSNGDKQIAISSNDIYLSLDSGISWSRQAVKPWPPETNFPLGDPFWSIIGTGIWYKDYVNFQDDYVSIATFGENNARKSYSIYTEGFFESGELDFYWRLRKRAGFDNVVLNFYVSKFNNNILEKTLITGLSTSQTDSSWTSFRYVLPESGYYNFEWEYSQAIFANPATGWIDSVLLPPRILDITASQPTQELLPFSTSKTGELLFSNNFGNLFSKIGNFDLNFTSTSVSSGGQYQAISTNNFIYTSFDFGNTWQLSTGSNGNWSDVNISNDGKYITAASINGSKINSNSGDGVWRNLDFSNDFIKGAMSNDGAYLTFTQRFISNLRRSASYGESFSSVGPLRVWSSISMSENGEYQTALASGEYIYVSNDYGLNWSGVMTDIRENWSDIQVSSNGQFQLASVLGGKLYFSSNYGQSWSGINLIKNWSSVALSENANILIATAKMDNVYYSYDSGHNWQTKLKLNNWLDVDISSDGQYQLLINNTISETQISYINFYRQDNTPFIKTYIGNITGYGLNNLRLSGFGTGLIIDPTGEQFQPAIIYNTGLLTGLIPSNSENGSFTWNLNLTGNPISGQIFLEPVTGFVQSSGIIEFLDITGSGLEEGDVLNISNNSFVFNSIPNNSLFQFSSPSNLVEKLNSGATGTIQNDLKTIGITGYQDNNKLFLFSLARSGESGNSIRIYRDTVNLNSIKIPNRYFIGGEDLRMPVNIFTGNFLRTGPLTIENSGVYTFNIFNTDVIQEVPGIVWEDSFENYFIETGIFDINNPTEYSGINLNLNNNIYSGFGVLPSGQNLIYTGLKIFILKPNPYNISGNIAKYIFSGDNFIFTDFIEG